ncbi:MAG: thioredoxin family protein [Planctomycetota bacterium]|nr:thioredoxin family protein [Planctomycetota bacterium]
MRGLPFPSIVLLLCLGNLTSVRLGAQDTPKPGSAFRDLPVSGMPDGPSGFGALGNFGGTDGNELTLAGELKIEQGGRNGVLQITGILALKWHTYALAQQGGPGPSKITVNAPGKLDVLGAFRPDPEPQERKVDYYDVPLLEHYDQVVWSAPVRLADGVAPDKLELDVKFDGVICDERSGCKPIIAQSVPIKFAGFIATAAARPANPPADATPIGTFGEYRAPRSHATIRGVIEPAVVRPGGKLRLTLTAVCESEWHIYAYAPKDPEQIAKPTLIALAEPARWPVGGVQASSQPTVQQILADEPPVSYHGGTVSWTIEIQVPADAQPGEHPLSGIVGYQTCTETGCDPPMAAKIKGLAVVGSQDQAGQRPLAFSVASYAEAARWAAGSTQSAAGIASSGGLDLTKLDLSVNQAPPQALGTILMIAFLGGLILNFMPCVLPVIGLKVMSFVQQAGERRAKVFTLNLWYTLGLVSVFMVLATLAAVFNLGWGEQFNFDTFNITMVAVVFAMGLSFLGVWEIPIPGFVGSGKAYDIAEQEGPAGAFAKGVVTTLLATPCSGPGLATALAWCSGKPAPLVYTVFAVMGLGMASPYLIIGANPRLVRFIPKPGEWMETFKQIMGFVLLGTVVYMLTFIHWSNVVPTLALLFALWASCWWIGRTPITEEFQVRLRAWLIASAFAFVMGLFAFSERLSVGHFTLYGLRGIMDYRLTAFVDKRVQERLSTQGATSETGVQPARAKSETELPWEAFSAARLEQLTSKQKTVLVDFTADWCLTCKFLEHTVLNTEEVRRFVEDNGVVTLSADWTDRNPEIGKMLEALGSKQVPVIAIFPAGRPNQPIVLLAGDITQKTLLGKLQEAGPSQTAAKHAGHAMVRIRDG